MARKIYSRRRFVETVGKTLAAGAAAMTAPAVLTAQKTDPKYPIVGSGEYRYECHHNWGQLPRGHAYGGASHGVTVDRQGVTYVTHHGRPGSIFVFDPEGRFMRSMGNEFIDNSRGVGHGIDIREEGGEEFLYLAPNKPPLGFAKMSLTGELVWQKDKRTIVRDSGKYQNRRAAFRATNISFSPDGGYYLGDGYGSGYIHRYDKNDKYVSSFGGSGKGDGRFRTPHGQWLDERSGDPKIAVCDRANQRLQYFDLEGNFLSKVEGFLFPADIDIRGDVMMVADLHARVTLLDKNNEVLTQLGDDDAWRAEVLGDKFKMRTQPKRWKPGRFVHPHDACFDNDGNIIVVEWVHTGRVSKLRKVS